MKINVISIDDAIAQGSEAWTMRAVADYWHTLRRQRSAELYDLKNRKHGVSQSVLRKAERRVKEASLMIEHFTLLAKELRQRGRGR